MIATKPWPCIALEDISLLAWVGLSFYIHVVILSDFLTSVRFMCQFSFKIFPSCLGGEKNTIRFMKRQGRLGPTTPLLDHKSERGVVKHPFPMNCLLKPWRLGQWFYQVVKFGIVQYVCYLQSCSSKLFLLKFDLTFIMSFLFIY